MVFPNLVFHLSNSVTPNLDFLTLIFIYFIRYESACYTIYLENGTLNVIQAEEYIAMVGCIADTKIRRYQKDNKTKYLL